MKIEQKQRARRNRTLSLTAEESAHYRQRLLRLREPISLAAAQDRTICQDVLEAVSFLPGQFADLAVIDPPYNLTKSFNRTLFKRQSLAEYARWLDERLGAIRRSLKPTASIYICSDSTRSCPHRVLGLGMLDDRGLGMSVER
jgi:site-specific DNA-methyltransferase (adenine-specific)